MQPSSPYAWPRAAVAAAALAVTANDVASAQDFSTGAVLRDIRISTRDVFDDEEAEHNLIYLLANTFHATTDPEVVRREFFFEPGEVITPEQVAELERNLRATRLFGEVRATMVDAGDGAADVDVWTRDRFSLLLSLSGASIGGVTKLNGMIGEANLFGTGKRISVTARREDEDDLVAMRYFDPQLFGSWYQLGVYVGDSTEGPFLSVDLRRPFKHLEDPWSHGVSGSTVDREVDYYEAGDVVASVPESRQEVGAFLARAYGPRNRRYRIGVDIRGRRSDYDATRGPNPALVTAPGDVDEVQLGVSGGIEWIDEFVVERGIDAIDFEEDIELGVNATVRTALAWRDEDGVDSELQPLVEVDLRAAARPFDSTYVTLEADGGVRWKDNDVLAWRTLTALHVFQCSLPAQTLAASLLHDEAVDRQELPPQLTLGEDNGLRGYPARQFAGDRLVVLNLEDRINTGLELWSVHLGAVAFYDMAWIHDDAQGFSSSDPLRSVGVGLRLGSSELLGSGVFRLDVAWPLDDVPGESLGVSISASAGQVFGLFGNTSELTSEFGGFFR